MAKSKNELWWPLNLVNGRSTGHSPHGKVGCWDRIEKMSRCTIGRTFTFVIVAIVIFLTATLLSDFSSLHREQHVSSSTSLRHLRLIQNSLPLLNQSTINHVKTFLFFVGYPRSGHSIVASFLDAHPDAVVAHEFNLFSKLMQPLLKNHLINRTILYNALYQNSVTQSMIGRGNKIDFQVFKGYSLNLNFSYSWHGKFRKLQVIGDKSGGLTSRSYRDQPGLFTKSYEDLMKSIQVPIKVLHVVRNPYDMIATRLLYRFSKKKGRKENFSAQNPITNGRHIFQAASALSSEAKAVNDMINNLQLETLEIHNVDLIQDTKGVMRVICQFLGLKCSERYFQMCSDAAFKKVSRSRSVVQWTDESRKIVNELIQKYPFFNRYTRDREFLDRH